jgi:hypothetical protein
LNADFGVAMKLSDSNQDDMDVVGKFNHLNLYYAAGHFANIMA